MFDLKTDLHNSSLFTSLENRNYVNKNISRLIHSQGERIDKQYQILEEITNF